MSLCIAAFVVLAFISIFSAKYRKWAREALECVMRRLSLRPCKSSFNQKMKAVITSKIMKRNRKFAGFVHRHFEAISWVFTLILFLSLILTVNFVYNMAVYGSCSPENPQQCVFNIESKQIECQHNCTPCWCGEDFICDSKMPDESCENICAAHETGSNYLS